MSPSTLQSATSEGSGSGGTPVDLNVGDDESVFPTTEEDMRQLALEAEMDDEDKEADEGEEQLSAEEEAAQQAAKAAKGIEEEGEEAVEGEEEEGEGQLVEAPTSWPAEYRADFEKIQDPEARRISVDLYNKMEGDYNRHVQHMQATAGELFEAMEPIKQEMISYGITPAQALRNMVGIHIGLRTRPVDALNAICQAYGIDLTSIFLDQQKEDPAVRDMRTEMDAMRQAHEQERAAAERQAWDNWNRAFQVERDRQQQAIDEFKKTHPLFSLVEQKMTELAHAELSAGRQATLEQLYETAVWLVPKARKLHMGQESTSGGSRKRVASARREAGSRSSGSSSRKTTTISGGDEKTTRQTLQELYDESQEE